MAQRNRGVMYQGPQKVTVETFDYPTLTDMGHHKLSNHGAIIKLVASCICGSDCHMARGRTPAGPTRLGHEQTGEVVAVGTGVEKVKVGDLVSVPFNVACGSCRNCKELNTNLCEWTNSGKAGGAYGYVTMGPWPGGQAEFNVIPYADFNLLVIPNKHSSMDKILDLAMLADILPTGFDAAVRGGVKWGDKVYIAGAGPVGLACAASCLQLLGASEVVVADYESERLAQAKAMGCKTIHLTNSAKPIHGVVSHVRSVLGEHGTVADAVEALTGDKDIDVGIDCAGFETNGERGSKRRTNADRSETLNDLFGVTRYGGSIGIPGVYLPADPGAEESLGKRGGLELDYGLAWDKGLKMECGQCPVGRYNRRLMNCILSGRFHLAEYLNPTVISLDDAPKAYEDFINGSPRKFVIDPHGMIPASAKRITKPWMANQTSQAAGITITSNLG